MKRTEIALAAIGIILLAWGGAWIHSGRGPMRDVTLDGGPACPAAPVRILEPAGPARGSVVVFHGLGANRIIMLTNGQQFAAAGFRVFLPDGPGHGNDSAPFSFAAYESCAGGLLATLQRLGEITPQHTVLLGHSLGAALVVRLADDFPTAATIAVATAPLIPPRRIPANLLLVAPQFDMPAVLNTEAHLASAAGAERTAPEDFLELRAFRLLPVPRRSHTSALFDSTAARIMLRWAFDAVGASNVSIPAPGYRAFTGGWLGILGILLLFPAIASAVVCLFGVHEVQPGPPPPQPRLSVLSWTALMVPAAILCARWTLLAPLHIYSADYLCSVLLLAGIPLAFGYAMQARRRRRSLPARADDSLLRSRSSPGSSSPLAAIMCGVIVGLLAILAAGGWLNLQLAELWPAAARWGRFPFLFVALFPICFSEEYALGDPGALAALGRVGRFALFLLLRAIVWLVMLGAWYSGVSSALLATIFLLFLAALSLGQRFGADALRHRTGSALAGAVFNAILGAWFLAAVFPLA